MYDVRSWSLFVGKRNLKVQLILKPILKVQLKLNLKPKLFTHAN